MIKSNYLLLSEGLNLDKISNLVSIFNIWERIASPKYPFHTQTFFATTLLERKDKNGDNEVSIEMVLLNNDIEIKKEKAKIKFLDNKLTHRRIIKFSNIKLDNPGKLEAKLYFQGKAINSCSIVLDKIN